MISVRTAPDCRTRSWLGAPACRRPISRLTSTLLQVGFLRQVPGRREFELSAGALGVGHAYLAANELLQAAEPLMQELADRLDLSVSLSIRDGIDMLYLGYPREPQVATLRLGVGSVLSMQTTSIGRACLWGCRQRSDACSSRSTCAAQGCRPRRSSSRRTNLRRTGIRGLYLCSWILT